MTRERRQYRRSGIFIVNFAYDVNLVSLPLTLNIFYTFL